MDRSWQGGGVASIFFGVPLLHWFSFTGAAITIVLLDFVAVMLLSGGTHVGLFQNTVVRPGAEDGGGLYQRL